MYINMHMSSGWYLGIYNNQSQGPPSLCVPDLELIVLSHVDYYHMLVKYWQVGGQIIQMVLLRFLIDYNRMKNSTK